MKNAFNKTVCVFGYVCLDMIPDLLNCGELVFEAGMLREIGGCDAVPGGVIGNTGLALHRLGMDVKLVGNVGDDTFGNCILKALNENNSSFGANIKVSADGRTGYCLVLSPSGQDRMFLAHKGVNDEITSADISDAMLEQTALLHFGYPPLCLSMTEKEGRETIRLFKRACKHRTITSLDMSLPSPGSFSYTMDWQKFLHNVLPYTNIFLPSLDELKFMLNPSPGLSPAKELRAMSNILLEMNASIIAIKLGSNGLYVRVTENDDKLEFLRTVDNVPAGWAGKEFLFPAYHANVVGTTGAGDAAIAGFLSAVLTGENAESAAGIAVATSACSVTAHDAVSGIKTLTEIRKMVERCPPQIDLSFTPENIPRALMRG